MKKIFSIPIFFILVFSLSISCKKEMASNLDKAESSLKENSSLQTPRLVATNEQGNHIFDMSNFVDNDYSNFSGHMTVYGKEYPTKIILPSEYLLNTCYEQSSRNVFIVKDKRDNSEQASITILEISDSEVKLTVDNASATSSMVLKGEIFVDLFENFVNNSCSFSGQSRWIPFAMAVAAAVTTVGCAIANSIDSSNCANTAAGCPNGVSSYEFEGGSCGNGDCNVSCN